MLNIPTYLDPRKWWCPVAGALVTGTWIEHSGFVFEGRPVSNPVGQFLLLVAMLALALLGVAILPSLWVCIPESICRPARILLIAYGLVIAIIAPAFPSTFHVAGSPLAGLTLLAIGILVLNEPGEA
jgi:hypothetical protein